MIFPNINFETQQTILESFNRIADKISNDIIIKINKAHYRIVDFEFYTYSEIFLDPHTYKHKLQLQNGKFYLHSSGIDITCGNETCHGGILLRSVIKLYDGSTQESGFMKEQFDGPQNVATELFSNLNSLDNSEKNEISLVDVNIDNRNERFPLKKKIIKTKRVGLTPKSSDKDDFYRNIAIRYIIILPKFPQFKQTIKGIENILAEQVSKNQISEDEAREILGYKRSFK
jgi:hypothetical protein